MDKGKRDTEKYNGLSYTKYNFDDEGFSHIWFTFERLRAPYTLCQKKIDSSSKVPLEKMLSGPEKCIGDFYGAKNWFYGLISYGALWG
jgi:hypothetical protein